MKCYKKERRVVYFEDEEQHIHFVPMINWELYMEYRKDTPILCRITDTIVDAKDELLGVYGTPPAVH